jgi:two-component system, chemotaxis family, chemotaxis protein CheY
MKILITDDAGIMRKIIARCVSELKCDVLEAENGQEALDIIAANQGAIDLVLLDWNMPVMSGFEALQKIKSNPDTKHIPVMMATTESGKADILKAIQTGATGYIVKPFQKDVLIAKIKQVLKI